MESLQALITKYNVPGPRYTSYPTVPHWQTEDFSRDAWKEQLRFSFDVSNAEGISLYIHLPYCYSLCTFCGCHKHITKNQAVQEPYIHTVLKEWQLYLNEFSKKPIIKELHLGGGTPTFFSPSHLQDLVQGIFAHAIAHKDLEMSFEGHPNNTSIAHMQSLYGLGFRRVSFGVQDYAHHVQRAINRIQPFERVEAVHLMAKEIGYTSISHDLVYGLPHQSMEDVLESIRLTNQLRPDRISLYSYAHVPWVKGVGQRGFDEKDLPQDATKRALYEAAKAALSEHGYLEVGMDHFALESDTLFKSAKNGSLHRNFMGYTTNNTSMMIGLGMSAISDAWTAFAQNVKTVKEYKALVEQGEIPVFRGHILSEDDLLMRKHILKLMCQFYTEWDEAFTQKAYFDHIIKQLKPLKTDGLVQILPNGIQVRELGKVFIRNICMCFDLYLNKKQAKEGMFSKTI